MTERPRARGSSSKPRGGSLGRELGKRRPFDSAEQEAFLSLLRTASALSGDFAKLFRSAGLSAPTYNALRILRGHHPAGVPSQTIGVQLVARVPDVTRLVDRLVSMKLAERLKPSGATQDKRRVMVRITPAGLALLSELDAPVLALHRKQMGHMTKQELDSLIELLARARDSGSDEDVSDPAGRVIDL